MSDHFIGIGGDGDLQAVVTGYSNPSTSFAPFTLQQDADDFDLTTFPDALFETTRVLDELEELYKPFYPLLNNPISPNSPPGGERETEKVHEKEEGEPLNGSCSVVKYKRKKKQQKRVVHQVTGQSVSSDVWCWRKYGQKPIKGSPYPRSYYKCSSSKGCQARKQVEKSPSDPQMFVITYTADHCHNQPTRRNSLAGLRRHKFPPPKISATGVGDHAS
ncbi:WRKY transcription factor [Actinidia chinensis var. chinensis]|uniref:WRKY transcription factor n=1 Tax=Actinidia chinensis var. chinensis TaxID=1590841 RepID=A0A2R6QN73_ACTCC|nr:WRKY transcription factor [Actinidia chinensis var. chinensis]